MNRAIGLSIMAEKTSIISDLSGKPADVKVQIGFNGQWYELDTTAHESQTINDVVEPYVSAGRPCRRGKVPGLPLTSVSERKRIRSWAEANGYTVPQYGRIPKRILEAYEQATGVKLNRN